MAGSPIKAARESDVTPAAEETLDFDDVTLRAIAELYKNEGNVEYKKTDFNNAIYFYTEGIKVNCKDEELKAKLYNNRAIAHFYLGNYNDSLSDAKVATDLQPSYVEAIVRGASACVQLNQLKEAITWCDKGLAIDKNNQKLWEIRNRSVNEQSEKLQDTDAEKKTSADVRDRAEKISASGNLGNIYDHIQWDINFSEYDLKLAKQTGDWVAELNAYGHLAETYYSLRDFKKSIHYNKHALKLAKELGDRSTEGKAYGSLGSAHINLGDFKTAIDYLESALRIAKESGDGSTEGKAYCNLGDAHLSLGDSKTRIDFLEGALKFAKVFEDISTEGKAYSSLGGAHLSLEDLKTAIDRDFELALNIAKELGDRSTERKAYGALGGAHLSFADYRTSFIDYLESGLRVLKKFGDRLTEGKAYGALGGAYPSLEDWKILTDKGGSIPRIAKALVVRWTKESTYGNLGSAHLNLGDFKTAIDYLESALRIAKERGDSSTKGKIYGGLGSAHQGLGHFKTAIDCHERALEIAKELGERSTEGQMYGKLGSAHESLGDFERAINYYKRALEIAKELGDRSTEGKAYSSLGGAHRSRGDCKTAIDYCERSLKIAKESGDGSTEGKAYCNLGGAHLSLGDSKTGIDYLESAPKIAKELVDRSTEGKADGTLGGAHLSLEDFKTFTDRGLKIMKQFGDWLTEGKADHQSLAEFITILIDYGENCLRTVKKWEDRLTEGKAYGNLGGAHPSLADKKKEIDYLESFRLKVVEELRVRSTKGNICGSVISAFLNLSDFKRPIDYYERSLKIATELKDSIEVALSFYHLGTCFESLGSVREALGYYKNSVTKFNEIKNRLQLNDKWKISLRNTYQMAYACLWRLLLNQDKVVEALFTVEQGRAQALKDLMKFNYAFQTTDAGSRTEIRTIHELSSCLPLNTIFIAIQKKEIIFWVCQKGENIELRRKQIFSQDDISSFLQCLMQIAGQEIGARANVNCEDRSLDITRDKKPADKRSPPDNSRTQSLNLQNNALSTLYDTLIDPIQDLLLGGELVFVPEGPLCLAPFVAFMDSSSKYLCESFRIRVIPSLTSLKLIADCPADYHSKSGALLVGDPWVQEVTELPPLSCAREEVEMIGRMLGSTPLIGRQATKDEVLRRLGSVALVHIAAHGDMKSGEIALAPTTGEVDYLLTMGDVMRVQMRARLVVLSCCHSARGEVTAEGVVGIARAFLGAGARSVLVSLWAIDDKATLEFMKSFYQRLVKGKSASEALNLAINSMRESDEFCAIKYWAPFVLIGDDVTLEFGGSE